MYTRALYRLYGYSPIYALRTSFGLLLQIPFFFAAYHLLNNAPELSGASWLFLADLSRPDALFSAGDIRINILPFVMTAANLLSAAVYTSRLSGREKKQLYGLAAIFLLLLYSSSSALLLYWTCNNLFSLIKNIIYTKFIYLTKEKSTKKAALQSRPSRWNVQWLDLVPAFFGIGAFVFAVASRKRMGVSPQLLALMATAAVSVGLALFFRLRSLNQKSNAKSLSFTQHYGLFPVFMAAVVTICVWKLTSFKKILDPLPWMYFRLFAITIGLISGWAFARQPLQSTLCKLAAWAESRIDGKYAGPLFTAASLILAVLVCWYTPSTLYASDPDFFYEPFSVLLGRLTFRALIFLAVCWAVYHWSHLLLRPFMALIWTWAALCALLYTFVAAGDYGTMDEFILQDPALLKTRLAFLVDSAVSVAAGLALWLALRRKNAKVLTAVLQGIFFSLCLFSGYQSITTPPNPDASLATASVKLPDYTDELFGFTPNGENTLVIMIDMFTGSHMKLLLDTTPELAQKLDGFTWYPDTMSPGATTLLSIGGLLGGEHYTPPAINARGELPLKEELHKAFATLPEIFVPRGYSVALADVDELVPSLFEKMCPMASQTLLVGKSITSAYTGYWREKKGLPSPLPESRAPFLASVGLFRTAPWVLRNHIYYDGSWLNTQTVIHNPSEGPYAMLDVLPDIANATNTKNTLKYVTSQVAHYPWRLDEQTCMPIERKGAYTVGANRVIHEHLVNERCGLLALTRFFDWMKEHGVYDNTQIILVSDHDGNDSLALGKEFDTFRSDAIPWKPDALLLVKQRQNKGALRVDTRPMSSADVVPLICAANGPCPGVSYQNPLLDSPPPRVRTHSAGLASIRRHRKNQFNATDYRVFGSMFDRDNWRILEKE